MEKIRDYADKAAKEIYEALGASPSDDQAKQTVNIIEQSVIKAVLDMRSQCADVAKGYVGSGAKQDMAHQIADEIRRANIALIANLSSLR